MCHTSGREECAKLSQPEQVSTAASRVGLFRGVGQIFRYNWHFYAVAAASDLFVGILLLRFSLSSPIRIPLYFIVVIATFWILSSLLVSHYIYDRSALYKWDWLEGFLTGPPTSWVNIHAGLDASSQELMRLFPTSKRRILDIYLPSEMSEPSIRRARTQAQPAVIWEKSSPTELPLEDGAWDTVFLIFVIHELRSREMRVRFFREIRRSLSSNGQVVLVEHLRDWKNWVAYGPGALHFFSEREWKRSFESAGFQVISQVQVTPFIRCFLLR